MRATLYIIDHDAGKLWIRMAKGGVEFQLPLNDKSIAGYVACSGKLLNIRDVYGDVRFNPAYDKKTGFRTGSMLTCPVRPVTSHLTKSLSAFAHSHTSLLHSLTTHEWHSACIDRAPSTRFICLSSRLY